MQISRVVEQAGGFRSKFSEVIRADEGLLDGHWEVGFSLNRREKTLKELVREDGIGERDLAVLNAMYDALQASTDIVPGGVDGVRSMDVWVGRFDAVSGV